MSKSLPIPADARTDPKSLEMIRVWIAKKSLHTALKIGFWQDQGMDEADCWGILLADMVRHIANAHETEYNRDPRETITAIRGAFEREIRNPTSRASGSFVGKRDHT